MARYIDKGGSILLTLHEGGEGRQTTNVNAFLKHFGIQINDGNISLFEFHHSPICSLDSVIRAAYYKYFYPKEALILDGVLNRAVAENAHLIASNDPPTKMKKIQNTAVVDKSLRAQVARYGHVPLLASGCLIVLSSSLEFVYAFGASLNVTPPSVPVLSTGSTCLPCQKPICAFYTSPNKVEHERDDRTATSMRVIRRTEVDCVSAVRQ